MFACSLNQASSCIYLHALKDALEDAYKSQIHKNEQPEEIEEPDKPLTDEAGEAVPRDEEHLGTTEAVPSPCSPDALVPKVTGIPAFNLDFLPNTEND